MTEYATFEDLTAGELEPVDVPLSEGRTVQVRGLSRSEHLWIAKGTEDATEIERRMLIKGMLQPKLTDGQLKAWQEKPGGSKDVSRVSDAIRALSGFGQGADKSDVPEVRKPS